MIIIITATTTKLHGSSSERVSISGTYLVWGICVLRWRWCRSYLSATTRNATRGIVWISNDCATPTAVARAEISISVRQCTAAAAAAVQRATAAVSFFFPPCSGAFLSGESYIRRSRCRRGCLSFCACKGARRWPPRRKVRFDRDRFLIHFFS